MKIISVIPLKKTILKGDLTYFTSLEIPAGNVVSVPIRKQKVLALVTSSDDLKDTKSNVKGMDFNLKKVTANLGPSVFSKEFLDSIFEACDYFVQNKTNAVASFIPNVFIEKYETLKHLSLPLAPLSLPRRGVGDEVKSEKLLLQYPFSDRISIYKTLVRESFARGKSVFLVLPTESDITKFESLLSKGIEQFTFSLHSGIPAKKNLTTYEKIMVSTHPVLILGTAPFLSIPRNDIGTIILEHENSSAYKMIGRPYFDLRFFAELYASKIKAKFIMADEMLRFETIGRMDRDHLSILHPLSYRIDFSGEIEMPKTEEGQDKKEKKKFQIIKTESVKEINSNLAEEKNVFIFSLRKGLATQTICKDCGDTVSCPECSAPLVLYLSHQGKKRMFACNRCEREMDGDVACTFCQSWNLMPLGIGTDTVHEEAEKLFPKVKIFKLDKESAKTAKGARDIIKEFESTPGSILIGTEMTFFYLKNKVPLSVIASFDSLWSIPNFRMSEKIIQIILSTLSYTTEKLIIQTKNEKDGIIQAIKSGNLMPFVREELEDRKNLDYPPFKRFIKITHVGDKEQTERARKFLQETFLEYSPEIFSGFVTKVKGKYVTNALIKIEPEKWSLSEISTRGSIDQNLLSKLSSLPALFEILVDPEDLL
jgi:primosomal protein N' (replication factor Y)